VTPAEHLLALKRRYAELPATSREGVQVQIRIRYFQQLLNAERAAARRHRTRALTRRKDPVS
jgi:hypothetical protein